MSDQKVFPQFHHFVAWPIDACPGTNFIVKFVSPTTGVEFIVGETYDICVERIFTSVKIPVVCVTIRRSKTQDSSAIVVFYCQFEEAVSRVLEFIMKDWIEANTAIPAQFVHACPHCGNTEHHADNIPRFCRQCSYPMDRFGVTK